MSRRLPACRARREFRVQCRTATAGLPQAGLPERRRHPARRAGPEAGNFARFGSPAGHSPGGRRRSSMPARAANSTAGGLRAGLDSSSCGRRKDTSILAVAVRDFFRREIEDTTPNSSRGLAFAPTSNWRKHPKNAASSGLGELFLDQHGQRLDACSSRMVGAVRETHGDVKDIKERCWTSTGSSCKRLGSAFRLVQPAHTGAAARGPLTPQERAERPAGDAQHAADDAAPQAGARSGRSTRRWSRRTRASTCAWRPGTPTTATCATTRRCSSSR